MRIIFNSLSHPKKVAKRLKHLSHLTLSQSREVIAFTLGYRDWHELSKSVSKNNIPSSFDEDLTEEELQVRFDYQLDRYEKRIYEVRPQLLDGLTERCPFLELIRPSAKSALSSKLQGVFEYKYIGNFFEEKFDKGSDVYELNDCEFGSYCEDHFKLDEIWGKGGVAGINEVIDIVWHEIRYFKNHLPTLLMLYEIYYNENSHDHDTRGFSKILIMMREALLDLIIFTFNEGKVKLDYSIASNFNFIKVLTYYIDSRSNVELEIVEFVQDDLEVFNVLDETPNSAIPILKLHVGIEKGELDGKAEKSRELTANVLRHSDHVEVQNSTNSTQGVAHG